MFKEGVLTIYALLLEDINFLLFYPEGWRDKSCAKFKMIFTNAVFLWYSGSEHCSFLSCECEKAALTQVTM